MGYTTKTDVYKWDINHLVEYLPNMSSYQDSIKGLNNLHEEFKEIAATLAALFENDFSAVAEVL
jgi:hypothetical protein